ALLPHVIKASTLAVSVIVMAVPEGLPMMITVVLSANMKRMLRDSVLVRRLVGIETAGSLNILFTDKTGTLTQGRLEVTHFINGQGKTYGKKDAGKGSKRLWEILRAAISYNSAAYMDGNRAVGGNATDRAALAFASGLGAHMPMLEKVKSIPFSSDKKYMATAVTGEISAVFIKGAPEKLLPACTKAYNDQGEECPFTGRAALAEIARKLEGQAIRLIAVAVSGGALTEPFADLTFVGLLGLRDDLRKETVTGVREVQNAGIQTVMITGDAPATALAIAKDAGLVNSTADLVLTSEELRLMSDDELQKKLTLLRVVARALPADKSRLVRAAQTKGLVVGMTGDGVNDAPALKQADVGFAMGSGTEVAKEAGDIVILDDNFASIAKAVCYGRTIFKSIRKFIIYQMSICVCALGVTVLGPFLGVDSPITVIQMLWLNMVMDTLAGLAFSGEKARKKYMREPPKKRGEPMLNSYMKSQIATGGVFGTFLCLFFLKSRLFARFADPEKPLYQMTAFFALFMFLAIFMSFSARTHRMNLLEYLAGNKPFIVIMGLVTAIQLFILYFGGGIFRTVQMEPRDLILCAALAFTVIPVDLIRKAAVNKAVGAGI
ncbi:MAG: HAD-IC family P-type ATPase, partial [Oscillospiraceae bacterium]|nr:HAD-IC family P-type ATPase [Oscillospiraceae bacterium]